MIIMINKTDCPVCTSSATIEAHPASRTGTPARDTQTGAPGVQSSSRSASRTFSVLFGVGAVGTGFTGSKRRAMRDLATKMAELKFEAPLAQFEESDEWGSTEFQSAMVKNENEINNINLKKNKELNDVLNGFSEDILNNAVDETPAKNVTAKGADTASMADNFNETFSGSLEDLVNTFDDKITKCFGNYDESVEKLAPVQVRSQEEIMNECQ